MSSGPAAHPITVPCPDPGKAATCFWRLLHRQRCCGRLREAARRSCNGELECAGRRALYDRKHWGDAAPRGAFLSSRFAEGQRSAAADVLAEAN